MSRLAFRFISFIIIYMADINDFALIRLTIISTVIINNNNNNN